MLDREGQIRRLQAAVDADRLWSRLMQMAQIGRTPKGGVNRQALSMQDREARAKLIGWAEALGFAIHTDAIGNTFLRYGEAEDQRAPITLGSHLDSQPTGGRFDGALGVIAAFEVLECLRALDYRPSRPIELACWTNEEGSRFGPATMGSAVYAGALDLDSTLAGQDAEGISVKTALAKTLAGLPRGRERALGAAPAAFLELHIEQGPVLERLNQPLGIVTGIQGLRWFEVTVEGAEAHAGTTPRSLRADALAVASEIGVVLRRRFAEADPEDRLRFTVGRLSVTPASPNTVPSRVVFTIDLRHPEEETLAWAEEEIRRVSETHSGPCRVSVERHIASRPNAFDPRAIAALADSAAALDLDPPRMTSGATHDAQYISRLCPTAMLFVPCRNGVSHREDEWCEPEHAALGARALAGAILALDQRHLDD